MLYEKTENLPMKVYCSSNGILRGYIELSDMAYPLTVRVSLNGKEIIPASFDCFGYPIFSHEQAKIYEIKNFEYKKNSKKKEDLKFKVSYRVDSSWTSRYFFDTQDGIGKSLVGLREFNRVLDDRKRYLKKHPHERLNQFVVFGKFLLDERAQVLGIDRNQKGKVVTKSPVESLEEFKKNNPLGYTFVRGELSIPKHHSICPCCGKHITIYDVKDHYCVSVNDKFYHESCYHELQKYNEIIEIIINIVGCAYGQDEYQYELLPNGYCNSLCCAHIPWFLVHTKYGDIVIGKRKRVISIEWQENFKPFDMNELFANEDVTKWSENGKCGIHAWSVENACKYLTRVNKAVGD